MTKVALPAGEISGDLPNDAEVVLLPYLAWNNRGNQTMIVWFPDSEAGAREQMASL